MERALSTRVRENDEAMGTNAGIIICGRATGAVIIEKQLLFSRPG
jgi:hypothetical protein